MKPQTPAEGIMLNSEWGDDQSYTIACNCHSSAHNVNMWIEVGTDSEEVQVSFYVKTQTPWRNRWGQIWQLLTQGSIKQEQELILSKQSALNLASAIKTGVAKIQQAVDNNQKS
jgi:hypothetical protein